MNIPILLAMVCGGACLGVFSFGGLWLTLHKLASTRRWAFWLGVSFLVRTSVTVTAFWFLAANDWRRMLALLTGFTVVRFLTVKRCQPSQVVSS